MDILANLNPRQNQAVTAGAGPVLVLAGPGSGKTRVLTQRIAYLIQGLNVQPYQILAVTFTNKAAREMQQRVETLVPESAGALRDLWLGTFHAMCARLLRREAKYLPFNANFVIMDSDDQETLVKRAIRELKLDEKLYRPAGVHASISAAKNDLIWPDKFIPRNYRDEVVGRVYQRYQAMLQSNNAVDFDDLLLWGVRLLNENPDVREKYARRFEHVLVDEFQDTNMAQYELIRQLSSYHHNLFVVGDEDQSIYRWRGADYRNVQRFETDFRGCQKILLEQNYRSTQTVLDAARAVIDRNRNRTPKKLYSDRGKGERITLYEASDDREEALFVVDTIQRAVKERRARGKDFAVMYRTNAQSRILEEAFLRAGLPHHLVGALRFYGRREVKDMIAYMRLLQNPDDEISLQRAIGTPPRGIGEKTLANLQQIAEARGSTAGRVLLDLGMKGRESPFWGEFKGRGPGPLADFGGMLASWTGLLRGAPLPAVFDRILEDIGYKSYLQDNQRDDAEWEDRWDNVMELRRLAFEYQERGITDFLETVALVSDQDTIAEQDDSTTLLTLHAAKGLEFTQVFIVGLDEGLLPHSRSRDDPEEMAEERRLFYVGLTRAKDRLFLVRADRRSSYGSYEDSIPSRFLEDIPDNLLSSAGSRRASWGRSVSGRQSSSATWGTAWDGPTRRAVSPEPAAKPAPVVKQQFRTGMHVRHASWGEGLVMDSRIQDDDETVDVMFESVGFKRVIASLAKLEIV